MQEKYAFKGIVEFTFTAEVGGHKAEQRGRLVYELTPDGMYFDPAAKREVRGDARASWRTEVWDADEGKWQELPYCIFSQSKGDFIGDLDEHLAYVMEADARRQSEDGARGVDR